MRTQFSIKQNRPRRLPPLDRLTSIEISCAKHECCPLYTNSVIDIFQDYIAQCDIVKLGVIPNFNRRATFVAQINAQTLYVRAEGPGRGASGLFYALKLSSINRGARKLVLHSTRHFIDLQCLKDEITVEDVPGNLSFVSRSCIRRTRADYEGSSAGSFTAMGYGRGARYTAQNSGA